MRSAKSKLSLLLLALLLVVAACPESPTEAEDHWATDTGDAPEVEPADKEAGLHASWDRLVRTFVAGDEVAYHHIKKNQDVLDNYLKVLAKTDPAELTRNEQLALWINSYNAFTVKLILRKYPDLDSIKDIPDRWELEDWEIGGKKYSLDAIEHQILRKKFDEPRIHAAINCASKSCPNILPEAYVAEKLDEQLDRAMKAFLHDRSKGAATRTTSGFFGTSHNLYLSKIFDWFEEDFEKGDKTVVDFVLPYLSKRDKAYVVKHRDDLSIEYFDYDWGLNAKEAD